MSGEREQSSKWRQREAESKKEKGFFVSELVKRYTVKRPELPEVKSLRRTLKEGAARGSLAFIEEKTIFSTSFQITANSNLHSAVISHLEGIRVEVEDVWPCK